MVDGTYSFGCSDPAELSNTLTEQYNKISKYMVSNKLVINDDKTHLVVMTKQGKMYHCRQGLTLSSQYRQPSC